MPADEEQWEIIKDTIDSSDYYVLIIAHRYGTIISEGPDAGISYTEKNIDMLRKKVFLYLRSLWTILLP